MLDTTFARPVGDAGNPQSWPFSVRIERVPGAFARSVVDGTYKNLDAFLQAGRSLERQGVCAVVTTCGFLVRHQQALAAQLTMPVETSPLMHFRRLKSLTVSGRVAILTIDASAIDAAIRQSADIPEDALIFSLPQHSHFVGAILGDAEDPLDVQQAESEWVELAQRCQRKHPDIAYWLFECANMPPYSDAVSRATGLPVYDTLTMGRDLHARATQ